MGKSLLKRHFSSLKPESAFLPASQVASEGVSRTTKESKGRNALRATKSVVGWKTIGHKGWQRRNLISKRFVQQSNGSNCLFRANFNTPKDLRPSPGSLQKLASTFQQIVDSVLSWIICCFRLILSCSGGNIDFSYARLSSYYHFSAYRLYVVVDMSKHPWTPPRRVIHSSGYMAINWLDIVFILRSSRHCNFLTQPRMLMHKTWKLVNFWRRTQWR